MILLKFRIFLLLEYICEGTGRHPCKCYVVIRPSDGSWTNLVLSTSYKIVILGSCSACSCLKQVPSRYFCYVLVKILFSTQYCHLIIRWWREQSYIQ